MRRKEQVCAFRHVFRGHSRQREAIRVGSSRRGFRSRQESTHALARMFYLFTMIAVGGRGGRTGGTQPALYRYIVHVNLGYFPRRLSQLEHALGSE